MNLELAHTTNYLIRTTPRHRSHLVFPKCLIFSLSIRRLSSINNHRSTVINCTLLQKWPSHSFFWTSSFRYDGSQVRLANSDASFLLPPCVSPINVNSHLSLYHTTRRIFDSSDQSLFSNNLNAQLTPQKKKRGSNLQSKQDTYSAVENIQTLQTFVLDQDWTDLQSIPSIPLSGSSVSKPLIVSKSRLLQQLAQLDDQTYYEIRVRFRSFLASVAQIPNGLSQSKAKHIVKQLIPDIYTILEEYEYKPTGTPSTLLDLNALKEYALDLTLEEMDEARLAHTESLYSIFNESLKQQESWRQDHLSEYRPPAPRSVDSSTSLSSSVTNLPNSKPNCSTESLSPWQSVLQSHHRGTSNPSHYRKHSPSGHVPDGFNQMPDNKYSSFFPSTQNLDPLISGFNVPEHHHSDPWKITLISIDERALHDDIVDAITALETHRPIKVTGIELFYDRAGSKRRMNAFVSLETQADRDILLQDRIRCFGLFIKGQRSPILDVEDKRMLMIRSTSPLTKPEIDLLLAKLELIPKAEEVDPLEMAPLLVGLGHRHEMLNKPSPLDVFVPLDGEGSPIGFIYITFPTHAHAYTAWHSLCRCNPGFIKAFWIQHRNSLFEQVTRTRDALAIENAQLRNLLQEASDERQDLRSYSLTSATTNATNHTQVNQRHDSKVAAHSSMDQSKSPPPEKLALNAIISNHIESILRATGGDIADAAKILDISARRLTTSIQRLRIQGHSVDMAQTNKTKRDKPMTSHNGTSSESSTRSNSSAKNHLNSSLEVGTEQVH